MTDAKGFDARTWRTVECFTGRCAAPGDVDAGAAVFAMGETFNGQPFEEPLPQPAIWYDEEADEAVAVLIVQAEVHESEDGERLEVLGLRLASGATRIGFTEDVEEVEASDPAWLALLDAEAAAATSLDGDVRLDGRVGDADDEDSDDGEADGGALP